jgi:isoleucyl-tRNA synthetase
MNTAEIEEKILKFWAKRKIFEKTITQRKRGPFFSFYDGPPFATGKPHYGHILATTIKDTVLRYWTMKGYQVPRRVGWDCHGLPVENLIEKELGIKNKREIESYGIEKFNQACRESVFRCVSDFEQTLKRVGRWADYKKAYATLDSNYIESVWWVLKKLWDQGLVYKDYRVSPYCPRCGTPLSNFEANQGYKDTKDPSLFVKFKVQSSKFEIPTYFLVWTTTPWTLPGNVGLAIHPQANYILVSQEKENYILAENRKEILSGDYSIIRKISGKEIVGLKYEPIFDSLLAQKPKNIENAFQVLPADFVSLQEGTGIVHIAPMYGEDDFNLGKKFNLPLKHVVNESGLFEYFVREFSGRFVKETDSQIIGNLSDRNLLYKREEILHPYPFCWRCDTPLLYYALDSWYIAITKFKKELIVNNRKIRWVPEYIKYGRFGNWLKEARDWNFSRNRFWGAPIPIWRCEECQEYKCVGSLKELGKKPKDLHRPYIDEIIIKCGKCKGIMKRIPEVFDCWFESGSMPYAQWHYPFENKKLVEKTFPADFIAEGLDQTRGWFYTLHVLATALTIKNIGLGKEKPAFKNVIVNGLILDAQGRKLSKRLRNYPEPKEVFDKYGADSLRYFLLSSTPIGEDYRFSEKGVEEVWRKIPSTILNCYNFFEMYKSRNFKPVKKFPIKNLLDAWIISRLQRLNQEIVYYMDKYEINKAARLFSDFIDDLSNWYIRRSRKREFSQQLYYILFSLSKLIAPFMPFIAEELYQLLCSKSKTKNQELKISVHLCDYPKPDKKLINKNLEEKMKRVREIVALGLAERAKVGIKVRQPLALLKIKNEKLKIKSKELLDLIAEELNVKKVVFDTSIKSAVELDTKVTPELREEGIIREIIRQVQEMRKKVGLKPKDKIIINYLGSSDLIELLERNREVLLKETFSKNINFQNKEQNDFLEQKELAFGDLKLRLGIKKW